MVDNARHYDHDAEYAQYAPAEDFALEKLKVYFYQAGEQRRLVASSSIAAASRLLDLSRHVFTQHGGETGMSEEIAVAMSDPGAVFQFEKGSAQWKKIKSSAAAAKQPKHGGPRSGSGPKPIGEKPMKVRTFMASDEQWETILQLGGSAFLRSIADKEIAKRGKAKAKQGKAEPENHEQ